MGSVRFGAPLVLLCRLLVTANLGLGYVAVLYAAPVDPTQAADKTTSGAVQRAWQSSYDRGQAAYAAGDLSTADTAAREALEHARAGQGGNQRFVASSLNLLALVRQRQGLLEEAVRLFDEAVQVSVADTGNWAGRAALSLNLGHVLESLRRDDEAATAYRRSLELSSLPNGTDQTTSVRAQALQALASFHVRNGDPVQAEQYNQQLLALRQGLSREQQVQALRRQSRLQQQQGQPDAAAASLRDALSLYDPQGKHQPTANSFESDESRISVLTELASLYDASGQYDLAEPLHRQAVAALEKSDPHGKPLAAHLNELGLWHLQRQEYVAAQDLLQRALAIVQVQEASGLETARVVANLAQLFEAQQHDEQAQTLYQQALAIYETHGDDPAAQLGQAQALNFLAAQDYRRRRFAQAEGRFLRALALTEQAAGMQSPRLLPLLDNLAALYRSQNLNGKAAPYIQRANQLRKDGLPM